MPGIVVARATSDAELADARALFSEYAASLGFSLSFQGFEAELESLPGRYASPAGCILLARGPEGLAGCVAMRPLDARTCEMKRLFVRPAFLGRGCGRLLAEAIVREGRAAGYARMRLDTVPAMEAALGLYRSLGFRDIEPYTENPLPGARFLELSLVDPGPVRGRS